MSLYIKNILLQVGVGEVEGDEAEVEVTYLNVYNVMPFSIVFLRWENSHANNLISTPICTTNIKTSLIPGMNTTNLF